MNHLPQAALPRQSCDNCRRRKVKCNRQSPCDKCQALFLNCSYSDVLRRKGPKFRHMYPLAPATPAPGLNPAPHNLYNADPGDISSQVHPINSPAASSFQLTGSRYAPHDFFVNDAVWPDVASRGSPETPDSAFGPVIPRELRLSPYILLAHVNVYLKYLFPIMPVVRPEQMRQDCERPKQLSPSRYAFLASLCAATHIQLKLDGDSPIPGPERPQSLGEGHSLASGEDLLREAERARRECYAMDNISIESLLTSFFLFASYGNLDRQKNAWFYLCQAVSMAFTLGLHQESTYADLPSEEAEERRRVFWLLFITERGYALQQSRPVMLRSSIHKPQVLGSEDPILAYGFINLISIFELLTPTLYDWLSAGGSDGLLERPSTSKIQSNLASPISLDGVFEIQQVDILITQQWLQAMMWKLSINNSTQPASGRDELLPIHLPVIVGKAVMSVISSASQGAIDAHGIGMEQKLFDMGSSIADVTQSLGTKAIDRLASSTVDPRQLLWGILSTLSQIRGSSSYLFPSLLERSRGIFGLDGTITTGDFLPTPGTTAHPLIQWDKNQGLDPPRLKNEANICGIDNDEDETPHLSTGIPPRAWP